MLSNSTIFRFVVLFIFTSYLSFQHVSAKNRLIFGMRGSVGISNSTGLDLDTDIGFQYDWGFLLSYDINPFLGIESGLQLRQLGFQETLTVYNYAGKLIRTEKTIYKYNYLTLPIYARFQYMGLYGILGAKLNKFIYTNHDIPEDMPQEFTYGYVLGEPRSYSCELHFGVGYRYVEYNDTGFFIELAFNRQLFGLYESTADLSLWNLNFGIGGFVPLEQLFKR